LDNYHSRPSNNRSPQESGKRRISAAVARDSTAHTVGRPAFPSCIVAAQYISLRLNDTSCVGAEIEPYARCAAIDAGGSPGVFVAVCASRDPKGYTGFRCPDILGSAHLGSPPSSNWGQAQPWWIVTAGKIIAGSGAVLCSVVVSVATT
jgi:hypothetical protein